jgi:hypothetical protein
MDPQAAPADAAAAPRPAVRARRRAGVESAPADDILGLEFVLHRQEDGVRRAYRKVVLLP